MINPPIFLTSCSSANAWITAPAPKNNNALKKAWFTVCINAILYWLRPTAIIIYPNWDIVLKAIILFKSFCNKPQVAAKNAVLLPIIVITNSAVGLYSKIGELLNSK